MEKYNIKYINKSNIYNILIKRSIIKKDKVL